MKGSIQTLISNGQHREALSLYAQSHASSLQPNKFTFPFILKACGELQSIPKAQQIHTHILKSGFQSDIYSATALTNTYMKLHLFEHALMVFDEIPNPTLPSFNAVISGFSQCGHFQDSLRAFKRLESEGFRPNSVTIASVLSACEAAEQGSQLHALAVKAGHDMDGYVATALVTMYSNCAELGSARKAFGLIREKTVVCYNAMISGFLRDGSSVMALDLFREMMTRSRERPSSSSLLSLLSACSELSALLIGKEIHCYFLKYGTTDVMVGTTLVDMYSKCGSINWAYGVFVEMGNRNIITWNSMISGLLSHGCLNSAAKLFHQLRTEGFEPDTATWNLMISGFSHQGNEAEAFNLFTKMQLEERVAHPSLKSMTSLLQACSFISDLQHGKEIHSHIIGTGAVFEDEFIQTALIHTYMNCGCPLQARRIFDRIECKSGDPILWNAMISGYGRNGDNESALEIFRMMLERRVKPDSATFLSALSVCSHSGQIEKGWELFQMMSQRFGVDPTTKHFGTMIDLLGRAGNLAEAWGLIEGIPEPSASMYSSLLGACECHSDAELGKAAAQRLSKLEPWSPTPLVVLSNIYARQGKCDDVEMLRRIMIDRGLNKVPGCSWIGVKQLQN